MILVIGGGPAGWLSGVGGPPEVEGYAAKACCRSAFQDQGRSSCRRVCGRSAIRSRTSASQACGSTSLSFAVPMSVWDLDQVASATAEHIQIPRMGIARQVLLNLKRQRVHAAAHVRHTCREPHPHTARNRDHRRSRTAITRASAGPSTDRSTITQRPPGSTISIRPVTGAPSTATSPDGGRSAPAPASGSGTALTTPHPNRRPTPEAYFW